MSIEQFPIAKKASSQLKWARYNPVNSKCEIDFKDKYGNYQSTYEYGNSKVPFTRQDWEDFRSAARPGEYFAHRIRGAFPYRKIERPKQPIEPQPQQERLF
jgi:hypothetical protein